MSTDVSC